MAYVDTCIVVSLFTVDALSEQVSTWAQRFQQQIAFSSWGRCEFIDVMMRRYRSRQIDLQEAEELVKRLDLWVAQEVELVEMQPEDFEAAAGFLGDPAMAIKSKDALHLAIAQRLRSPLVTSDLALARASDIAGVPSLLLRGPH